MEWGLIADMKNINCEVSLCGSSDRRRISGGLQFVTLRYE